MNQRLETGEWEETATGQRRDQSLTGKLVKEVNKVVGGEDRTPRTQSLKPKTDLRGNNPGKEEDEVVLQTVKSLKNLSKVEIPVEQVNQKDKTPLTVNQILEEPTERRARGNIYNTNKGRILQNLKTVHQQRGTSQRTKGQRVPVAQAQAVRVKLKGNPSNSMDSL